MITFDFLRHRPDNGNSTDLPLAQTGSDVNIHGCADGACQGKGPHTLGRRTGVVPIRPHILIPGGRRQASV